MKRAFPLLVAFLAASVTAHAADPPAAALPQLGKAKLKSIVAAMTLEEKAAMVVGEGGGFGPPPAAAGAPGTPAAPGAAAAPGGGVIGATQRLVPGAAGTTHAVPRLGVDHSVVADGPAGLRIAPPGRTTRTPTTPRPSRSGRCWPRPGTRIS